MPYLCTDIAGDPLWPSLSVPFLHCCPALGLRLSRLDGNYPGHKESPMQGEGGIESRVRRLFDSPPWPPPIFLAYWLPVNMQHCLTDCNEPQIDQATPGNPSTPLSTLPFYCWTPLYAYVCVSGNLWLISYAINPRATPRCPLLRCWQQLPLVVATPATPPSVATATTGLHFARILHKLWTDFIG